MTRLKGSLLLGCFFRTYLATAAYNPRGLQNIGFIFAIEPALAALYGPGQELCEARLRYARNGNCHQFFTPMLLGLFLHLEAESAAGRLKPAVRDSLRDTMANSLSAIGDSFFNGAALASWAMASSCLVLTGLPWAALAVTFLLFVLLQIFKAATFIVALRNGMAALFLLRRLDLINWGDRLKYANAALLILFLWLALPGASALSFGGLSLSLLVMGWMVGKRHAPRMFVALLLLAAVTVPRLFALLPSPPFGMIGG